MFEGLRDEVDKARWKRQTKEWKKLAATVLEVKRRDVYLAVPADALGNRLVVYYRPATPQPEVWCLRVNALVGFAIGDPIRFTKLGDWIAHAQNSEWEQAWPNDPFTWDWNP